MANEFKVRKGLIVQGSGSTILDIFGSQGELFSVTDSLSGSLFSVNDISGIPIMEVFSDNTIKMGTYNQEAIIVSGSRTGMGTALPQAELHISGANSDSLLRVSSPTDSSILVISGSGNVGIGTSTPAYRLDVSGSAQIFQNSNSFIRFLTDSNSLTFSDNAPSYLRYGSNIIMAMKSGGGNSTILYGAGSSILSATQNGVSIRSGVDGTLATSMLQVRGSGATSATTALRIENSNASASLVVLDNSSVGIGTASPTSILDASVSNGATSGFRFKAFSDAFTPYLLSLGTYTYQDNFQIKSVNGLVTLGNTGAYDLAFQTNTTEYMRITSAGNVGIGTTSPTAKLQISTVGNGSASLDAAGSSFNGVHAILPGRIYVGASSTAYPQIMYNAIPSQSAAWRYAGNDTAWAIDMGGNNQMRFRYAGAGTTGNNITWTDIMVLASGSGNVGIGTSSPTNRLEVAGGVTATSFTGSLFGTSSWAQNALTASFLPTGTYNITSSWAQSASNAVNAQTASRVTNNLTQGTGITSFTYNGSGAATVSVAGASSLTAGYLTRWNGTSFVNSFISQSSPIGGDIITIGPTGTTVQSVIVSSSISSTGNITAPSFIGTSSWATNALTASFITPTGTNAFVQDGNSFGATAVLGTNDNQNLQFETNGTVRMHISSSGNVGVGLTNPSAKLYVSGAAADRLLHVGSPSQANILFVTG